VEKASRNDGDPLITRLEAFRRRLGGILVARVVCLSEGAERGLPTGAIAGLTASVNAFHRSQWSALTRAEPEQLDALLSTALWGEAAVGGGSSTGGRTPTGAAPGTTTGATR
jgi:hypothetical protein